MIKMLLKCTVISVMLVGIGIYAHWRTTEEYMKANVRAIYKQILATTGQTQEALPLVIVDSNIDNAFNDGSKVVIYTGLIHHTKNWNEVALVLGHEVAHGMLWHLRMQNLSKDEILVIEANADKMGAFYAMKAGYDICVGRHIFKTWKEEKGNALAVDHPDYSYRYEELNINCGD